ncbi:MAG TPA: carboxypeptidase-like regulatory domain-containing protein [Terriglobales bacterium]|nr:carboxypeptidase-like regulatory domain-containing protein [Terriglobales bacterium]
MVVLRRRIAILAAIAVLVSTAVLAQMRPTGRIVGSVEHPSGAVVAGATVTLTDEATRQVQSTTAGPDGGFVFISLQVGTYSVSVTHPDFSKPSTRR